MFLTRTAVDRAYSYYSMKAAKFGLPQTCCPHNFLIVKNRLQYNINSKFITPILLGKNSEEICEEMDNSRFD